MKSCCLVTFLSLSMLLSAHTLSGEMPLMIDTKASSTSQALFAIDGEIKPNSTFVKVNRNSKRQSLFNEKIVGLKVGDVISLESSDNQIFQVTLSSVKLSSLGSWVVSGGTQSGGVFVLVVSEDGKWIGSLSNGADFFSISSNDGTPRMKLRDQSAIPRLHDRLDSLARPIESVDIAVEPQRKRVLENQRVATSTTSDDTVYPTYSENPVIDVLFYYDSDMPSPLGVIDYYVANANYHFENTDMGVTVRAVKALPLSINNSWANSEVYDRMKDRTPPYDYLNTDRRRYKADLVYTVRATESRPNNTCGLGRYSVYKGRGYRDDIFGVADFDPDERGGGSFCYENIFTHELGHSLGSNHDRDDYSDDFIADGDGAYSYSFGSRRAGVYRTVMVTGSKSDAEYYGTYSTPEWTCGGLPCGLGPNDSDAADNRRSIMNTRFIVAAYDGEGFDYAAIQEIPWSSNCSNGSEGFRGVRFCNNSQYTVEVKSRTFLRPDGSIYSSGEFDAEQFVFEPGENRSWGYCGDGEDQPIGSEVTEAFFTYKNPETGQEVEGTHIFFDDDYEGDYGIVRAAAGVGGSVVGNPSIHARVDAEVEITFEPDYGYKLDEVTGTCPGSLHYNVYTVEPLYGDCWAVASFRPLESAERAQQTFNNLLDTVILGRGG